MSSSRTRTVIHITGEVVATGISPQKATALAMSLGANPAGVHVVRGSVADAKAAMARMADRAATVWTTDRIEAARMGVAL